MFNNIHTYICTHFQNFIFVKFLHKIINRTQMASKTKTVAANKSLENFEERDESPYKPPIVPKLKLNDNNEVPIIGFETRKLQTKCKEIVIEAIQMGYRHIDCAEVDGNEKEIGDAIKESIKKGLIARKDMFITSKVWNNHHSSQLVRKACEKSLKNLCVTYLDSYVMHSPMAFLPGDDYFPKDECGKIIFSDDDFLHTWHAMEKLVKLGLVKSLGLSNFNIRQIILLLDNYRIKPALLHIECHPYLNQQIFMDFCAANDIAVIANHCFGRPSNIYRLHSKIPLIHHPKIQEIALKNKMTPPQVLIKYQIQRGNIVVAAALKRFHIKENILSVGFNLSSNNIFEIDQLETGTRLHTFSSLKGHLNHPFENDLY